MGGPKKFSKPGQNINLKANHTNFCSNCHKIKLCVRPEARASAQAPGMLGPPMPISLILFVYVHKLSLSPFASCSSCWSLANDFSFVCCVAELEQGKQ